MENAPIKPERQEEKRFKIKIRCTRGDILSELTQIFPGLLEGKINNNLIEEEKGLSELVVGTDNSSDKRYLEEWVNNEFGDYMIYNDLVPLSRVVLNSRDLVILNEFNKIFGNKKGSGWSKSSPRLTKDTYYYFGPEDQKLFKLWLGYARKRFPELQGGQAFAISNENVSLDDPRYFSFTCSYLSDYDDVQFQKKEGISSENNICSWIETFDQGETFEKTLDEALSARNINHICHGGIIYIPQISNELTGELETLCYIARYINSEGDLNVDVSEYEAEDEFMSFFGEDLNEYENRGCGGYIIPGKLKAQFLRKALRFSKINSLVFRSFPAEKRKFVIHLRTRDKVKDGMKSEADCLAERINDLTNIQNLEYDIDSEKDRMDKKMAKLRDVIDSL